MRKTKQKKAESSDSEEDKS
jgi:hypothetical protein